jgi:flagellar basal-body rod protein FlgB
LLNIVPYIVLVGGIRMNLLQTSTLNLLSKALDASTLRQRVIANNIANADTPGYKSKEVLFEEILRQTLVENPSTFVGKRTHPKHIPIGKSSSQTSIPSPMVVEHANTWVQNNGNNVDIEYEMTKMAENQLWYNALVQQTAGYFNKLRDVIKEGR